MADVKEFPDERYAIITSKKFTAEYTVQKDRSGHRFFEFKISKGNLPEELKGKFSSISKAVDAFEAYERVTKQTQPAKRKELQEEREAKRAKLHSQSS